MKGYTLRWRVESSPPSYKPFSDVLWISLTSRAEGTGWWHTIKENGPRPTSHQPIVPCSNTRKVKFFLVPTPEKWNARCSYCHLKENPGLDNPLFDFSGLEQRWHLSTARSQGNFCMSLAGKCYCQASYIGIQSHGRLANCKRRISKLQKACLFRSFGFKQGTRALYWILFGLG